MPRITDQALYETWHLQSLGLVSRSLQSFWEWYIQRQMSEPIMICCST